jgi:hypothetical protein
MRKMGTKSIDSFFLFMSPYEQNLPIYGYARSHGNAQHWRVEVERSQRRPSNQISAAQPNSKLANLLADHTAWALYFPAKELTLNC